MKLASLFSGGKDSTYAIYDVMKQGHQVVCLLSILANSDESHLLHHPNMRWTKLQSDSMGIPHLFANSNSDDTKNELVLLERLLLSAKNQYGIEGLVHGGIKSKFQKNMFEQVCSKLGLVSVAPLWESEAVRYMNDLLDAGFVFVITSVSSDGLDDSWLGQSVTKPSLDRLRILSDRFGFNLNFEGGEAETFVLDCPLFDKPIKINHAETAWDGYRGRFEIVDAELNCHA